MLFVGGIGMSAYFKRMGTRLGALFSGGVLLREQKLFLAAVSLFFAAAGLAGIFINTYLYSCAYTSGELVSGIKSVAYYNLCLYASMAVFSVVIGITGKAISSRVLMVAGLCLYALVFALLLLLGKACINYIWALGFLNGMGTALFQFNYGDAVTFATSGNNRDYYLSIQGGINALSAVLAPLIAGVLVDLVGGIRGYTVLFSVVLAVLAACLVCCLCLTYSDGNRTNTHFGNVFVYSLRDKSMRYASLGELVSGFREGVMAFLVPVLLFVLSFSNSIVGLYAFLLGALQLSCSRCAEGRVNGRNRALVILLSCLLNAGIGFVFLSGVGYVPIFSYGVVTACVQSFFAAATFFIFYDAAYKIPNSHYKNLEILTVRELYRNAGRAVGIFALLLVPQETKYMVYAIIGLGISQLIAWGLFACAGLQLRKKERRTRSKAA